jgi:hypothetical protein
VSEYCAVRVFAVTLLVAVLQNSFVTHTLRLHVEPCRTAEQASPNSGAKAALLSAGIGSY